MRIAAGVLIILVGILNLFAGLTYGASSAVVSNAGKIGKAFTNVAVKAKKAEIKAQKGIIAKLEKKDQKKYKKTLDMAKKKLAMLENQLVVIEKNMNKVNKDLDKADPKTKKAGMMMAVLGILFLLLSGLTIAAAVVLFREKAAMFAISVGVLQLIAEVLSYLQVKNIGPVKIFAVVSAVLVILAAMGYKNAGAEGAPEEASA